MNTQPKKPKFEIGQHLFTPLFPGVEKAVARIKLSLNPSREHFYKFQTFDAKGTPFFTHWIAESQLFAPAVFNPLN